MAAPMQGYTIPVPYAGINLVDPIDRLPELFARNLLNMYPVDGILSLRRGYTRYSGSRGNGACFNLATLNLSSGLEKLVSIQGGKIYDCTTETPVDITGATNPIAGSFYQFIQYRDRLWMLNGLVNPQVWTGTGAAADTTFTGPIMANLISGASFNSRIYFIEKDTLNVHYSALDTITGALTSFPFLSVMRRGGKLIACGSWTNQTSTLSRDLFFALSSEGELVFYQGIDPADDAWSIVARFYIGKPVGYRCTLYIENDLWILTDQGIVPVSQLFSTDSSVASRSISKNVNKIIKDAVKITAFSGLYGATYWSRGTRVFITYPVSEANEVRLLVANTETGAWTVYEYANLTDAVCLTIFGNKPYAGALSGNINELEYSYSDDGAEIPIRIDLGFNFFGRRDIWKVYHDLRILASSQGNWNLQVYVDTDFRTADKYTTIGPSNQVSTPWGSPWGSPWSSGEKFRFERNSISGQGHCAALRISGSLRNSPLDIYAFEIRYKPGSQV